MKKNTNPQKKKRDLWPPLKIQYEAGVTAFLRKKQWLKTVKRDGEGATVIVTANPHRSGTMEYKEWQRGYDNAYTAQLQKQVKYERNRAKHVHRMDGKHV